MRPSLLLCLVAAWAALMLVCANAQSANFIAAGGGGGNNCKTDCPPRKPGEPMLCGTDGTRRVLFNNYCAMQMHNCLYDKKFRYFRRGSCY